MWPNVMIARAFLFAFLILATPVWSQAGDGYVGSERCIACHRDQADLWAGSHHALAWTLPGPDTVVADFNGTEFSHGGMAARFRIADDGSYRIEVTESDGATTGYRVHSVAGIEPLQQYLIETEPGRLQSFDIAWDTERGEWFHLYPDQDLPPGEGMHWTGPYKNWNGRCAECHATGFEKNYDATSHSFASTQAEIGVGCEACHGPGRVHLSWAEGGELAPALAATLGFTMDFADPEASIQQCAGCHSLRETFANQSPLPGTPYHDAYNLSLLRPGLYFADGQILSEVYVYGSFLQSRMYASGVSCMNCHDPHAARPVAKGNAVCTQCHTPAENPEFPQAAGAYDTPEHHFHEAGTAGAECKSCHMPERVYMGVDWRADHSFRIPRLDLAAVTGAPDACTSCHADRTVGWAAGTLEGWYPDSPHRGSGYGEALAAGRADAVSAAGDLADLAGDRSQPAIVRATAMWLLEQANSESTAERLAPVLGDSDPLLRAAAAGVQRTASPQDRVQRLIGLLGDPVRTVRIAAARQLLGAPIAYLPETTAASMQAAMNEWQATLTSRLDFPETHLQLAGIALTMRNFPAAAGAFREVVALDPQRVDAWSMLIRIAAATEGEVAARRVLDRALAANPHDATLLGYAQEFGAPR